MPNSRVTRGYPSIMSDEQDPTEAILAQAKELGPDRTSARVLRNGRSYISGKPAQEAQRKLYRARLQFVEMLMARDMWTPELGKRIAPYWIPDTKSRTYPKRYMRSIAQIASHRVRGNLNREDVERNLMVRAETGSRQLAHGGQWRAWARVADVQMRLYGIGRQGDGSMAPNVTQNVQIVTSGETKMVRMGSMQSLFRGREPKALPPGPVEPSDE